MSEKRIQFSNIVRNQLPAYVREEFPLVAEFLSQYYLAQEFQGYPIDLIKNLLNPKHIGFGERMEIAEKKKESTDKIREEDKNVNYVFRNASKEEVDNVLSDAGKTGDFWRSEPNEYKNYGDFINILKKIK